MAKNNKPPYDDDILDPQEMYVTLELDDGSTLECQIYTIFEVNGADYIALIPDDGSDDILFYKYFEDEDGMPSIDNIIDDDEFDNVVNEFDLLMLEEEQ